MTDSIKRTSLDGVRVLNLEHGLVGPWTTQQLGDLGAEVFKIEPPEHGDYLREFGPFVGDRSAYFFVNLNK